VTKKVRKPQAPKQRNFVAKAMLDRNGPYTPKAIPVQKKPKYKKNWLNEDQGE
tara:strand:- start:1602 stop:1760 length:159 start_codon:yes stop_codon:yes gene_type:complete